MVLNLDQRHTFSLGCSRQHYGRDGAFKPCKVPYGPLSLGRGQAIQGRSEQALLTGVLGGVRLFLGKRPWKEPHLTGTSALIFYHRNKFGARLCWITRETTQNEEPRPSGPPRPTLSES